VAENEANVIKIDGNEYDPSDLTDQQKYWIAQVQDLQKKRQAAQFQLDQIAVAADSFMNALIKSLSDEAESKGAHSAG
jgi:alpha-N-acetylglucosamine transferase